MEHRVKKPVDYKVLNTKGKVDDVFDISTEMTPIKSKSVSKIETIALIHDDSDDGDGVEDNGSDCSLSDDEELVALKKIGWQIFFPGGRRIKNMQICLISQ